MGPSVRAKSTLSKDKTKWTVHEGWQAPWWM